MRNVLFSTTKPVPVADVINAAGAPAYSLNAESELAQYVLTGCFNGTYYATGEAQLDKVKELCGKVSLEYVAKLAVYARKNGLMKDTPAFLLAYLCSKGTEGVRLCGMAFQKVCDNPKLVRNFVQIIRSGVLGRKSLGTAPKRFIQQWLDSRTPLELFRGSIGTQPSLADVIKMVHPHPSNVAQSAMYAYLIGKPHNPELLPEEVIHFEAFKREKGGMVPDVPFEFLTALPLSEADWKSIAQKTTWTQTRMNLNTFLRHGVLKDKGMVKVIAARLRDPEQVKRSRCFPYQLMTAFHHVDPGVPVEITNALQDAMETATENVPELPGDTYVFVDVSGSMHSPVTGSRGTATSKVNCIQVAALFASSILRKNPNAGVMAFSDRLNTVQLNPRDSVMTNANKLASLPSGGTNCALPLAALNGAQAKGDNIIYVSDNESWLGRGYGGQTATQAQWNTFKQRNKKARMVCIDLIPNSTVQVAPQRDVLNVGGFSDNVFSVVSDFLGGKESGEKALTERVKAVKLVESLG